MPVAGVLGGSNGQLREDTQRQRVTVELFRGMAALLPFETVLMEVEAVISGKTRIWQLINAI